MAKIKEAKAAKLSKPVRKILKRLKKRGLVHFTLTLRTGESSLIGKELYQNLPEDATLIDVDHAMFVQKVDDIQQSTFLLVDEVVRKTFRF